ncbi:MYND finger domain containing protein [Nitzschia inconspicua]|uniref:MYND finger domain containing protein n=1 Tax=Nitzschia inconspicua TaxID=303405 RepID=A0A9K3PSB4_9STRA|nr:MYND finger domain containing protein [Nitzschia inconspicua]
MGLSSDGENEHIIPTPIQYFQSRICQQHPWMVDLDDTLLRVIYRILGDLMIKRRINLMPYFTMFRKTTENWILRLYIFEVDYCQVLTLPMRLCCIVGMIVMNAYMIASFLRGMQESGSVIGPSLSTAANFTTSAIYGALLWHERMNLQWCVGFVCLLVGVMLLSNTTPSDDDERRPSSSATTTTTTIKRSHYAIGQEMRTDNDQPQQGQQPSNRPKTIIKISPPQLERGKVASMVSKYVKEEPSPPKNNNTTIVTPVNRPTTMRRFQVTPSPQQDNSRDVMSNLPSSTIPTTRSTMIIKTNKSQLKPESKLKQYYSTAVTQQQQNQQKQRIVIKYDPRLVDNNFVNECALCCCDDPIFDTITGESTSAVADLSPNTCFHIFHAKCLKQSTKAFGNACPLCDSPLAMWSTAKQAAQFPGFWLYRVERYLLSSHPDGPPRDPITGTPTCVPASEIRQALSSNNDPTFLTDAQKMFIQDDPSGMGKGLQAALEWGGYRDYNTQPKGHVGFHDCLRTKGLWKYDPKKDDVWCWTWGTVHPRQRCHQCQLSQRPLPVECPHCVGSAEAAVYCSTACSKRDWQRHKQVCQKWTDHGPNSTRSK